MFRVLYQYCVVVFAVQGCPAGVKQLQHKQFTLCLTSNCSGNSQSKIESTTSPQLLESKYKLFEIHIETGGIEMPDLPQHPYANISMLLCKRPRECCWTYRLDNKNFKDYYANHTAKFTDIGTLGGCYHHEFHMLPLPMMSVYFRRTAKDQKIEAWQAREILLCFSNDTKNFQVVTCKHIGDWVTFGPDNTILHIGGSACQTQIHKSCSSDGPLIRKLLNTS